MNLYTIVGFWPDTGQRFAECFRASSPAEAEALCAEVHKGLAIVATFNGDLYPVDGSHIVTYT